jgi:hypothetical protein
MLGLFLSVVISTCSVALPPCTERCFVLPPDPAVLQCVKQGKDQGAAVQCVTPDRQRGYCAP